MSQRAQSNNTNTSFYEFGIGQDKSYVFGIIQRSSSSVNSTVTFSVQSSTDADAAIKGGPNQINLITIVVLGSDFYLFVNKRYIDHISDSTLSSGKIGVSANAVGFGFEKPTDVAFSNANFGYSAPLPSFLPTHYNVYMHHPNVM